MDINNKALVDDLADTLGELAAETVVNTLDKV